jgi:predicted SAM-dependent methyltransferase
VAVGFASRSLESVSLFVAWLRRHQHFEPEPGIVKVNLGAGITVAPGWINIDTNASSLVAGLPPPLVRLAFRLSSARRWVSADDYVATLHRNTFVHHNLVYGIPIGNERADFIYSAHFFEHVYRDDAQRLFREALRVLKPGGIFRINVPSLDPWVEALASGDTEHGLDGFFARSAEDETLLGRHRYMYNFDLLSRLLREAGFADVQRRNRREGATPDLDLLEKRSEHGLYVEAAKRKP